VWTGSGYGVAWYDLRDGNHEIYFARLTPEGVKVGGDVRVTTDASGSYSPSLVWTGSGYGVAWPDDRDGNREIYFARITPEGVKVGGDVRVTADGFVPSLVWTGSGYGVAWQDDRDGNWEIYFARLTPEGVKVGGDMRVTTAASSSAYPSLVWTGSGYGVAWYDHRDGNNEIYFARLGWCLDE
jgi:hypothetical protein